MTTSPLGAVLDALAPAITNHRSYWSAELDALNLPEHENQFALNFPRATFARWLQRVRPMTTQKFWALIEASDTLMFGCAGRKRVTVECPALSLVERLTFAATFAGFARTLESAGISYDDAVDIVLAGEHAYSVAERLCGPEDIAWLTEEYLPEVGIPIGGGKPFVTDTRTTILSELNQAIRAAVSPQAA